MFYGADPVMADDNIYAAVALWFDGQPVFGAISDWDVSNVTSFDQLFCGASTLDCPHNYNEGARGFNEKLSKWDTSSAENLNDGA